MRRRRLRWLLSDPVGDETHSLHPRENALKADLTSVEILEKFLIG